MELQLDHCRVQVFSSALLEEQCCVGHRHGDLQRLHLGQVGEGPGHCGDENAVNNGAPSRIERTGVDASTRDVSLPPATYASDMDFAKVCAAHG